MEDILAERRSKGDLCWVLKPWSQDVGDFSSKLLPTSLLDCVKTDPAVATEVAQLPAAEQAEAWRRIEQVFTEMHHSFSVGSVRRVGYSLAKIFKQLYDTVQVERAGIEQVRALPSGVPTLYLPTHRSYVDFLLVSYVCFHYGLPLPVIAAGMDFLSMLCVGDILRSCGAFFIRRRLNGDRLYAAVLRAYVQALALTSPQPAEFFIEGTRSRSGKPLPPRTGLLSAYLELYHSGRIPDLHIVPISISYERVLEENLYAYEMLGTPKPAESTGRLVGAVSVLAENYGSVHVRLLGVHSLRAAGAPCSSSSRLAAAVLRHQLCGARLSASCLLLAALQLAGGREHLPQLLEVAGFIGQRLSEAHPQLSVEEVTADSARRTLHMHHSLLSVSADRVVELRPPTQPASKLHRPAAGPRLRAATVTAAIPRIRLQLYVNPLLPHIAGPALAQLAIDAGRPEAQRTLYELMAVEFPTLERWDADTTTATVAEPPHPDAPRWLQLQTELIRPYLEAYRATVAAVLESLPDAASPGTVQHWAERHVDLRRPEAHLCLCRDVITNCTTALVRMGAGTRNNGGDNGTTYGNGTSNGSGNGTSNGSGNGSSNGSGSGSGNGGNGTSTAVQWRRERLEAVAALLDSVCGHGQRRTAAAARL